MSDYTQPLANIVIPSELRKQMDSLIALARAHAVNDTEEFLSAGRLQVRLRRLVADVTKLCDATVKPYYAAWKDVCRERDALLAPLKEADAALAQRLLAYKTKEEQRNRAVEDMFFRETGQSLSMAGPPKIAGLTFTEEYDCEVTDFPALVKAVADGKAPIDVLSPNMTELRKLARAMRDAFALPGCTLKKQDLLKRTGGRTLSASSANDTTGEGD